MATGTYQVQRVGAGVLAELDGITLYFESRSDAAAFGRSVLHAAVAGPDVLDVGPEQQLGA